MEKHGVVSFIGNPLTLTGNEIQIGSNAPDFVAIDKNLRQVKLSDFKGEIIVISSVPSLDTPVCEKQTKKFNQEAACLNYVKLFTISMDLPFAQTRFCDTHNIQNITLLSDYKEYDFSQKYGLFVKELGLLARAVLVIDPEGKIIHFDLVKEMLNEPDYRVALEKIKSLH